ncbi:MAG: recombination mediator RecR [Pseudomonadota bacterium]|nr:recombination mediator RecR [Pseudomonadota bacterium]
MSSLDELIDLFARLPSLGPRSARRIVLYLLKNKEKMIPTLIASMDSVKSELVFCKICGNVDLNNPCKICNNKKRNDDKICVVEDVGDLWAIEKSNAFDGHYHVIGGVLSAMDGIGPEQLNLLSLFDRIKNEKVGEIIIATNATVEGQITAQYIADHCSKFDVLITRLAQGMPIGGELDLLDYNTLSTAFSSRLEIKTT